MHVYRLARRKYASLLDGQGAALFGGRWNSVGQPVVYTAQYRSLAVLEYRVNNPLPMLDLLMITIEVPTKNLLEVTSEELPDNWSDYTLESPCVKTGDQWLKQQKSLLLSVPSVVVPLERNILINPLHPKMDQVRVMDASPFLIDQRTYGTGE